MRIAVPDLVTNSYFPALAAEELGLYRAEGVDAHVDLLAPALGGCGMRRPSGRPCQPRSSRPIA